MFILSFKTGNDYVRFSKHSTKNFFVKNSLKIIETFSPSGKPICLVAAHSQYMNTASYAAPCISACE